MEAEWISEADFGALIESELEWIVRRGFRVILKPQPAGYAAVLTDDAHWLRFTWAGDGAILLAWGDVLPPWGSNDDPFRESRPMEELSPGRSFGELEAIGAIVGGDRATVRSTLERLSRVLEFRGLAALFEQERGVRRIPVIERNAALRSAYLDLVRQAGLNDLLQPPPLDAQVAVEAEMSARWQAAEQAPTAEEWASRLDHMRSLWSRARAQGWSVEQVMVDALAAELDTDIPRVTEAYESQSDDVSFYVGIYPTGKFNAEVREVPGVGYVVLVNHGLMMLFYQTMRIYSWSVRDATDPPPPPGGTERMARGLAAAMRAYLEAGASAAAAPFEPVAGPRAVPGNLILTSMEKFVLAHEYGHIIGGHLRTPTLSLGNAQLALLKRQEQEFEADAIGMMLLLSAVALPNASEFSQYASLKLACEIAGPVLSLEIGSLLMRAQRVYAGLPEDETYEEMIEADHPGGGLRTFNLKRWVRELGLEAHLALTEAAQSWMRDIGDLVIEELKTTVPPR